MKKQKLQKTIQKTITFGIMLFLVFSSLYLPQSPISNVGKAYSDGASWYNASWGYRKSHTINAATGAGTNYQVKIIAYYGSGTDSAGTVYFSNKSRTDFADVRFTGSDGTTLLDYWIASTTTGVSAEFWVEVAEDLSSVNRNIFVYYGNAAQSTNASNGSNTFLFFDDFSGDLSKWTVDAENTDKVTIVSGVLRHDPDSSQTKNAYFDTRIQTAAFNMTDGAIQYKTYLGGNANRKIHQLGFRTDNLTFNSGYAWRNQNSAADGGFFEFATGAWTILGTQYGPVAADTWLNMEIRAIGSNMETFINGSSVKTVSDGTTSSGGLTSHVHGVSLGVNDYVLVDDIRVRKIVATEPVHSTWGTEETSPSGTSIYRSVAPSATSAIATTTASNITISISGNTATFSGPLPLNVGVGDAILYDSDNNSSIDSLAFIHGRTSASIYTVFKADGSVATSTSANDADWRIYRAYTSLSNATKGIENTGITTFVGSASSPLANFDDWTAGGDATTNDVGKNISAGTVPWNITLYANGTTADASPAMIDGWTTSSAGYINIYTPTLITEVGVSQRHSGKWDNTKYHLEVYTVDPGIYIKANNVYVDGIQVIAGNDDYESYSYGPIGFELTTTAARDWRVSNSIIKSTQNIGIFAGIYIFSIDGSGTVKLWNNIIYNFNQQDNIGGIASSITGTTALYIYNNTIVDSNKGISITAGSVIAKNNIVKGSGNSNAYEGTFASGTDYNATDGTDNIGQGSNNKISQTFTFVNEAGDDYHLASSDGGAKNSGADLTSDANISFSNDIDGNTRPTGANTWDIGADEFIATIPTVTTQSASSVTATSAVLNGNITDTGGASPTVRGFAWGTNANLSGGDTATTTENGTFTTGAFTGNPGTLTCNTTYYSRAYATNSAGTSYGAISSSFTTSACQVAPTTTLNTPADSATGQSTTPTLNFTGTDSNSDVVEYNVQVSTSNTFPSSNYVTQSSNGPTAAAWSSIAVNQTTQDVYAVVSSVDIYKQTGGTGSFVAQGAGSRIWYSIAIDQTTNDVYAVPNWGDIYKQTGGTGSFVAQGAGSRNWYSVAIDSTTHDVYAVANGGGADIYKQTGGTGSFVAQGVGALAWQSIAIDSTTHDVYAVVYGGDIYKQTAGSGSFVAQGAGSLNWYSVAIDSTTHDVYAVVYGGDIYKQTAGSGSFVAQGAGNKNWRPIAIDSTTHDVYAVVYGGDIYKQTGGTGSFAAQGAGNLAWNSAAINPINHNVYVAVSSGDIYKQTAGSGSFVAQNTGNKSWKSIAIDSTNHNVYAVVGYGDIYKQTAGTGSFVAQGVGGNRDWRLIAIDQNTHDVYAVVSFGDIYKQTAGSGSFVAQGAGSLGWYSIAIDSTTHDVYVTTWGGDIYKQTAGTGSFVAQGAGDQYWAAIAIDSTTHDVYAPDSQGGDIYKQTAGTGSFVAQGAGNKNWKSVAIDSTTHDVYAVVQNDDIYKQTGGTGSFVAQNTGNLGWNLIGIDQTTHDVYVTTSSDGIYKQTGGTGSFVAQNPGTIKSWGSMAIDSTTHDVYAVINGDYVYKQIVYPLLSKVSTTDTGFTAGHPFTSGVAKDFTVQAGDTLTPSTTYYWRVRAIDPTGSNSYGAWSSTRSFTVTDKPTVTTQSASSVTATTAVLNGNITATGGAGPTVRGFAWGTSSTMNGDTATTTENGAFSTGAFTGNPGTLTCNTTYYSRAYATNSAGTSYGAISSSFTTSACGITISGTLYEADETTPATSGSIKLSIAGGAASTASVDGSGNWSFTGLNPTAGQTIFIWTSGDNATLVFKYGTTCEGGTTSCTGLKLFKTYVIIGVDYNNTANSINITDLAACDSDSGAGCTDQDDYMVFSNILISNAVRIKDANAKFAPGGGTNVAGFKQSAGSVTGGFTTWNVSGDFVISGGTFTSTIGALTVTANWSHTAGTFTHNNGTVIFDSASAGKTINALHAFNNVVFNREGGVWSPLTNTMTVAGDLTMSAGTLNNSNGSANVVVNGNIAGTAGVINLTAGTFTQNVASNKNFGTTAGSTAWTFNNLTFTSSAGTPTITTQTGGTGAINISGVLTVGANTILGAGNRTWTLSGSGTPFVNNGAFTPDTSTVVYSSTSATNITNITYNNLTLGPNTSGSPTYTLNSGGSLQVGGIMTLGQSSNPVTIDAATNNPSIIFNGNLIINSGVTYNKGSTTVYFSGVGTSTITDNTISKQDLGKIRQAKDIVLDSDVKMQTLQFFSGTGVNMNLNGSHTLSLTGTGDVITDMFGYGTSSISPLTGTIQYTGVTANVAPYTYNNLTLGGTGTYTLPASDVTLRGDLTVTTGATVTKSASNKLIFAKGGGGTQTLTGNATNSDLGLIKVSANSGNTTLNLGSSVKVSKLTIDASQTFSLNGTNTLTLTGTGTTTSRPLINNGIFTASTGTVEYKSGNADTDIETTNMTYYDLTVDPVANFKNFTFNGVLNVSHNLTINPTTSSTPNYVYLGGATVVQGVISISTVASCGAPSTLFYTQNYSLSFNSLSVTCASINFGSSAVTINGSGNVISPSGLSWSVNADTSIITYKGTSATNIFWRGYNVVLAPESGNPTYTFLADIIPLGLLTSFHDFTIADGTHSMTVSGANNPTLTFTGDVTINTGVTYNKGSGVTTFKKGSTGQTITDNTATKQDLGTIQVSSNTGNTTLNLGSDIKFTSLTVDASQTFSQGASYSLTTTGAGTVITNNGIWSNLGTGDITLSGDVTNAGTITLNGNGGSACNGDNDDIMITSSNTTPRTWSGAGTFTLEDVAMSYMTANANITLTSSTNSGNNVNGTGVWTWAGCKPTVTTQSASSVTATSAVLNGNITDIGVASPTVRGFAWGTNSGLSGGDTATTTDTVGQPFGTGAFTGDPGTLTCGTTYYARPYATNSAGTEFGPISNSFTTSACQSSSTYTQSGYRVFENTAGNDGFGDGKNGWINSNSSEESRDELSIITKDSNYIYLAGFQGSGCVNGSHCWRLEKRDITTGAIISGFGTNGVVISDPTSDDDRITSITIDSSYIYVGGYQNGASDGGCVTGGTCWRLEKRDITTGALVTAFDSDGIVQSDPTNSGDLLTSIAIDSSYIYLGGYQETGSGCVTGGSCWRVEKRDITTGQLVGAFDSDGIVQSDPTNLYEQISSITIDASYIYLGGNANSAWRLEKRDITTGALVNAFGSNGVIISDPTSGGDWLGSIVVDDSYVYLGGESWVNGPGSDWRVEKRDKITGALVGGFGSGGVVSTSLEWDEVITSIAVDSSYIYLGGLQASLSTGCPTGSFCWRIEKRNKTTGALINAFDSDGKIISDPTINDDRIVSISIDSSYIYIGGHQTGASDGGCTNGGSCWRLEKRDITTGALVTAFDSDGIVQSDPAGIGFMSIQSVTKDANYIYTAGYQDSGNDCVTGSYCWRLEKRDITSGDLVTAFDSDGIVQSDPTNGMDIIYSVAIDSSYIYLAGYQATGSGCVTGGSCWRLEKRDITTGALVTAFDSDGIVQSDPTSGTDRINSITIDSSYIYLGGYQTGASDGGCAIGSSCWRLEKRDITTGALVTAFDSDGIVQSDPTSSADQIFSVVVDSSYIYLGGYQTGASDGGCAIGSGCWRLEKRDITTGALVTAFDSDGIVQYDPTSNSDVIVSMVIDSSYIYLVGPQNASDSWLIEKLNITTGSPVTAFGSNGIITSNPTYFNTDYPYSIAIDEFNIYLGGTQNGSGSGRLEKRDIITGALATTSINVGTPLANLNTGATLANTGDAFRLRMLLHIGSNQLDLSGENFKLQYALKNGGTYDTFADVTASTPIAYKNNSSMTDGITLTTNANNPTHSSDTIVPQTYEELNNFTNSVGAISVGQDGLWDFALYDNSALAGTTYGFRIVKSDGTPLDTYTYYPEVTIAAPSFPNDWTQSVKLSIDHTKVPGDLTNFPVLVTEAILPNSMKTLSGGIAAQADGGDIRFTSDAAGLTQLATEIVTWTEEANPANSKAEIWVKLPTVSSTVDTDFYVWWSAGGSKTQPLATDTYGSRAVWSNGYVGVWHLNETPVGAIGDYKDSTGVNNSINTTSEPTRVLGKIGEAANFSGATGIRIADNSSLHVGNVFTIEEWVQPAGTYFGGMFANNAVYGGLTFANTSGYALKATAIGVDVVAQTQDNVLSQDTMAHVVYSRNTGATNKIYVNGTSKTLITDSATGYSNPSAESAIGETPGYNAIKGIIDETRLSSVVRSQDWILAEYNNQNSPSTFVTCPGCTATQSTFTQSTYQWFDNANSLSPGSSLSSGNSSLIHSNHISPLRLRIGVLVGGSTLSAGTQSFRLQWSQSTSGGWRDVKGLGTNQDWKFYHNTTPTSGGAIQSGLLTGTNVFGTYQETAITAPNPANVSSGQIIEYDFALDPSLLPYAETYYFRLVKSNGLPLDTYSVYPSITTGAQVIRSGGGGVEFSSGGGTAQIAGTNLGGGGATGSVIGEVVVGPNNPTLASTDNSNGGGYWSSGGAVDGIKTSENDVAIYWWNPGYYSVYAKATNFNFAIPINATINGISLEIKKKKNGTDIIKDYGIKLVKGGVIVGADRSNDLDWPTTYTYISYGGASDLWGENWTPADINNTNFGMVISIINSTHLDQFSMGWVDHIRMTVYYTPAPEGSGGGQQTEGGDAGAGGEPSP
jgi:hypothetical protein